MEFEPLIPEHGGFRKLKSFQLARLIYDVTVRFCDRYVERRSRTRDQMVQAARSGVQNIAEGSQASGTSKKMEMKLTSVARASLEELRLDYEDFLRQRGFEAWKPDHPALRRFKAKRCSTLDEVRGWVEEEKRLLRKADEHGPTRTNTDGDGGARPEPDEHGPTRTNTDGHRPTRMGPSSSELVANAALSLLNLCCHFLDRQLAAQADAFVDKGGFTERLYNTRQRKRRGE